MMELTPRAVRQILHRELDKEALFAIVQRKKFIRIARKKTITDGEDEQKEQTSSQQQRQTFCVEYVCSTDVRTREKDAYCSLAEDALAVTNHRDATINAPRLDDFSDWLGKQRASSLGTVLLWVRCDDRDLYVKTLHDMLSYKRDFVFNARGIGVLEKRYLAPGEPIQFGLLRIAATFAGNTDNIRNVAIAAAAIADNNGDGSVSARQRRMTLTEAATANGVVPFNQLDTYLLYVKNFYDLISLGILAPSSILAFADKSNREIHAGEACRLMVCNPVYDDKFITQMDEMRKIVNLGVGIGLGAYTVPLHGSRETGKISSGFRDFVRNVESCNCLTIHTRLPKVALYIYADNDTVYEAFSLKRPTSESRVDNVFFALMLTDFFVECVRKNQWWYLFSGQLRDTDPSSSTYGCNLWECQNDKQYRKLRDKFIAEKFYTRRVLAADLMNDIVQSICVSGSPYIIWIDNVNKYNNQHHLGTVKTLNLCAEITNYADHTDSSSCTLMSVNMAAFDEHEELCRKILSRTVEDMRGTECDALNESGFLFNELEMRLGVAVNLDRARRSLAFYAYFVGYMATVALNNLFGKDRRRREIGVTPFGMYDAVFQVLRLRDRDDPEDTDDVADIMALASECLYKGCLVASCNYTHKTGVVCANYRNSRFYTGDPQWHLRATDPTALNDPNYRQPKLALYWNQTRLRMCRGMANSMLVSQAPTATTSLLTGACESVTVPLAEKFTRENANGRSVAIPYCLLKAILNDAADIDFPPYSLDLQLKIYERTAPFVDHSQSTIFMLDIKNRREVFDLICKTYRARLKTGIYYIIPRNNSETLTIIRNKKSEQECEACSM